MHELLAMGASFARFSIGFACGFKAFQKRADDDWLLYIAVAFLLLASVGSR